ncbi:fimbrillin family protein [Prevotella sp. E13-17]|uniref:fimbrillin family protein n=1 Tax=Prevotella sp. E13-17 TaxID=2913616 RepID=UPI001EDBF195|nr:fimbrillin family protein [Prevotella sp. E13-17]UKK51777.1 fimbrillin family protein [Prevotella sp. E13-17]
MKTTKYLSLAALALMGAFASCQSDDDFTVARPDNAVSVNFSVGSLQGTTRSNAVATDDTQRQFNQGDQISVSTNDQEAVLFQCTSTENQTWTETVPNKFLLWTQPMLTFSAYYPVTTGTSMTTFTVPTDQSSVEKIALADYMTRQQVISRPEGGSDIQMQLERKMARVIVRISDFGSQYRDDQKTVDNVRIYSEASGIAGGNPTGSSTEIQPYAQGSNDGWGWSQNSTFTALVVPGYGDSSARFIQLSDGEGSTLLVKGIPELEAGNSYTFNLVVGKNRIEVASVTVQDWTTGETLAGGQATESSARTLAEATAEDLGKIVGADGKIYDTKDAAEAVAIGNAVAMIAYVGTASDCAHGLAIALADESGLKNYGTAGTVCSGKAAVTGSTWRLPSEKDWQYIFIGCGSSESYSAPTEGMKKSYSGLASKLTTAQGDALQAECYYWSSTESNPGSHAWGVYIYGGGNAEFNAPNESNAFRVRACLAF